MTLEQTLESEIESAVDQSIEDDKGFVDPEGKPEEKPGEPEEKPEEPEEKPEEKDESNEDGGSEQEEDKGVAREVGENESTGTAGEDEEGKGGDSEESKATSGSAEVALIPAISEVALELAIRSGLTVADAKSFGNDQALLKVVQIINEKTPSGVAEKEHVKKELLLHDLPDLDPEQYEPEAIETFKKMKDAIQSQQKAIEQLTQETQSSQANQAAQNEREITAWFDGRVTGLGNDYEKALGKGSHGSLDRGSSQFAKREEIIGHISLMAAGYSSTGREVPSLDTLFDQATKFVLQDEMSGAKDKQLSDRLRKRAKQHINRAGSENVGKLETAESSDKDLANLLEKKFFKGE